MGNIISDSSGNIRTFKRNGNVDSTDAFTKNITDALFELNLYNTGNFYANGNPEANPRSEFDYTSTGISKSTSNIDLANNGRHSDGNGNYVDMIGLKYTDDSVTIPLGNNNSERRINASRTINALTSENNNNIASDQLYNLKRGFCMAGNEVPIDILGVDVAYDDPNAPWKLDATKNTVNPTAVDALKSSQLDSPGTQNSIYHLSQDSNEGINSIIENCLTWGNITPPSPGEVFDVKTPIPDININSDKLNDFSTKNIYGNPLSAGCISALDKLMMNSYVSPLISNYSKIRKSGYDITKDPTAPYKGGSSINFSTASGVDLYHNPATGDWFTVSNPDHQQNTPNFLVPAGYKLYNAIKDATGSGIDHNSAQGKCGQLEQDVCNYHYYYDLDDGILFNKSFNPKQRDISNFNTNLRYLNERIPDCRCLAIQEVANKILPPTKAKEYLMSQYQSGQCNKLNNYGVSIDITNSPPNYNGKAPVKMNLYNYDTETSNITGYRRQFDPTNATGSGLSVLSFGVPNSDSSFLFVPDGIRTTKIEINNYTCTISQNINVTGVAGTSIINGIKAACNFNGGSGGSGGDGTSTAASESGIQDVSTTIAIAGVYYMRGNQTEAVETSHPPVSAFQKLKVKVTWPRDSANQSNFIGNYQFALYLASDPSKMITLKQLDKNNDCNLDNLTTQSSGPTACISPYRVTMPFVYGSITDNIGIKYNLKLQSTATGSNKITTTNGISINVKQYSMRIVNTELKKINSVNYLHIGINLNTLDKIENLGARVILTPVETATSAPAGCTASTTSTASTASTTGSTILTQYFPDLFGNLIDGALFIGDRITINPTKYYYTVMLNESIDLNGTYSGGVPMLYDQQMPLNQQCVVDFSTMVSSFVNVKLEYVDTDDNNSINVVLNKSTVKFGALLRFTWQFNSVDDSDTTIDIYYDTAPELSLTSTSAVKLSSGISGSSTTPGFPIDSNSTATTQSAQLADSNYLTNTFEFVCPIIQSGAIIIYGVVNTAGGTQITSPIVPINLSQGETYYKNWQIQQNTSTTFWSSPDMTNDKVPLPLPSNINVDATIDYYFNLAYSNTTPYNYIIYDQVTAKWYGGNGIITQVTGNSPLYTIFKKPDLSTVPTLSIVAINGNSLSSTAPTIQLGQIVTLTYTITPTIGYNTNLQIVIGDVNNPNVSTVIETFPITPTTILEPVSFTLFYDVTITNPCIYITSYNTFTSNKISFNLNMSISSTVTLTSGTSTPPYQAVLSTINPIVNILALNTNADSIINNLSIAYNPTTPFTENKYYVMMSGFAPTLSVAFSTVTFSPINLNLPLNLTFLLPTSAPRGTTSYFTNVGKEQKLESFYGNLLAENSSVEHFASGNNIHIDTLQIDLSKSTLSTLVNIQLLFSGYTQVYIQNLEIIFGQNKIDNTAFNINFPSDSNVSTFYVIPEITFVGILTTRISLLSTVPGLTVVSYAVPILNSTGTQYVLVEPLTYSNGYYILPESYNSNLEKIQKAAAAPVPVKAVAAAPPPSDMPIWQIFAIIVGVLILIGICVFIYFKFIKKSSE